MARTRKVTIERNGATLGIKPERTSTIRRAWEGYMASTEYSIEEAYGRYSREKKGAEDRILREMLDTSEGEDYRIIGHNSFVFSCGYTCMGVDVDTDEAVEVFVYHTSSGVRYGIFDDMGGEA